MKEKISQLEENQEVELSQKAKILEFVALAMGFMLLAACFLKVMFF